MNTSSIVKAIAEQGGVEGYLTAQQDKGMLRFLTCGSVDDGKSTLIGRLLHDTRQIYEDHLSTLQQTSKRHGTQGETLDLALLVAGLQAEREQGITIDVAYRYFSTEARKFIIADTPGHEQYTRNMATGASTCELAVVLIDARKGVLDQTRRHSFIATLLGIKHMVVAVNKMDLVAYDQAVFERIRSEYDAVSARLPAADLDVRFIPLSALTGDNVVLPSAQMPWYTGPTLLSLLETINVTPVAADKPLRFPVQYINRPDLDFRGYAGTVAGGHVHVGQAIRILPSGQQAHIDRIVTFDGDLAAAHIGQAVTLTLDQERDISRGDLIIAADSTLTPTSSATLDVVWMAEQPLMAGQRYTVKVAGKQCRAYIDEIVEQIDVNTLHVQAADQLSVNGIGRVRVTFDEPIMLDPYQENTVTGGMIFIDLISNVTVGAGMVNALEVAKASTEDTRHSAFERELNALIRRHFPHWHARDITQGTPS